MARAYSASAAGQLGALHRAARLGGQPQPRSSSSSARLSATRSASCVAAVARELAGVGLHAHAHRGHARDARHVVGAVLDLVERLVDGAARAASMLPLRRASSARITPYGADELRLGRLARGAVQRVERVLGAASRSPRPSASMARGMRQTDSLPPERRRLGGGIAASASAQRPR